MQRLHNMSIDPDALVQVPFFSILFNCVLLQMTSVTLAYFLDLRIQCDPMA